MEAKDWTLLVIAASGQRALSPVQLQKALFLMGEELNTADRHCSRFYEFRAYDYGPFNSDIYQDAEALQREDLITISGVQSRYRTYRATTAGLTRANALRSRLNQRALGYLDTVVPWVQSLSFEALVKAIYKAYPRMAKNSIFRS